MQAMSSNSNQSTNVPQKGWGQPLLLLGCVAWIILIAVLFYKYRWNIINVFPDLGIYGGLAGGLFWMRDRIKKECDESRWKRVLLSAFYWGHLALVGWGIYDNYPLSPAKILQHITQQIKDSVTVEQQELVNHARPEDCPVIGLSLKIYQHRLTDSLLEENFIKRSEFSAWRRRVDSIVGDPVVETCRLAGWQQHFALAVRSLAGRKAAGELDALLRRFGISPQAKVIEQVGNDRYRSGTIRNYLLRTIQGIQPMFMEVLPKFNDPYLLIEELVLIVNS
jgi:hypothetical protein